LCLRGDLAGLGRSVLRPYGQRGSILDRQKWLLYVMEMQSSDAVL